VQPPAPQTLTPGDAFAPVLMAAGIIGLGLLLMISIRSKIARRNAARPSPRELIDQLRAPRAGGDDADARAAGLADLARRLAAQLDSKSAKLEILIRQADERIAALAGTAAASVSELPGQSRGAVTRPPVNPLARAVYDLADAGRDPVQIARELDQQVGTIELILALRAA
jgi:hypothetical protein